tara:strand:+ start:3260 stop:3571 length:312 start_codon:yes stop_codon:yes gene_type:complete
MSSLRYGDIVRVKDLPAVFMVYRFREDGRAVLLVAGRTGDGRAYAVDDLVKLSPKEVATMLNGAIFQARLLQDRLDAVSSAVEDEVSETMLRMSFNAYGTLDT